MVGCSNNKNAHIALTNALKETNAALLETIEVTRSTAAELQKLKASIAAKEGNAPEAVKAVEAIIQTYQKTESAEIKIETSQQYIDKAKSLSKSTLSKVFEWFKSINFAPFPKNAEKETTTEPVVATNIEDHSEHYRIMDQPLSANICVFFKTTESNDLYQYSFAATNEEYMTYDIYKSIIKSNPIIKMIEHSYRTVPYCNEIKTDLHWTEWSRGPPAFSISPFICSTNLSVASLLSSGFDSDKRDHDERADCKN